MAVTVKEVARRAEVSTATVSHVLTGNRFVSEELKNRVLQAMDELNYQPNTYARSLKINRTYKLGVHVPDITNPFFSEIVKYICREAAEKHYQVELCISNDDTAEEMRILKNFQSSRVDGIINVAPKLDEKSLNSIRHIPMVIVDRPDFKAGENISFVFEDNFKGGELVADYLAEKKYTRFACFMGSTDIIPNAKKRLDGFLFGLEKHGFKREDCIVRSGEFSFDSGYQLMDEFLKTEKDLSGLAAFIGSDVMAWGAVEALKDHGIEAPRDIGIVGYDNIYYANYISPKLTTVENPTKVLGKKAARKLIETIEDGNGAGGTSEKMIPSIIPRESC